MSQQLINLLLNATWDTLYMVAVSLLLGTLVGGPIGIFLATSRRGELFAAPWLNKVSSIVVNAARSIPFIILAVAIVPFTRALAGTSIGTTAAMVPTVRGSTSLSSDRPYETSKGISSVAPAFVMRCAQKAVTQLTWLGRRMS